MTSPDSDIVRFIFHGSPEAAAALADELEGRGCSVRIMLDKGEETAQ